MAFTLYKQLNAKDCGPTCLRMVSKHYGKHYTADTLRQIAGFSKQGVSMLSISETAEKINFRTRGLHISYDALRDIPLPAILHWNENHFTVLIAIDKSGAKIADPASGIMQYTKSQFLSHWQSDIDKEGQAKGTVLVLEPNPVFYESSDEKAHKLSWHTVTQYLRPNRSRLIKVIASLGLTSVLQLIFPFLTQSMVDVGINAQNMQYVVLVLIAQLMLTFSTTVVGFIRSRLQLRMANNINISILSDFWIKVSRLPLAYFDAHHTGDIMQRLRDNKKIQDFLTGTALTTLFSLLNFIIYAVVLIIYSVPLFIVFTLGNLLYFGWILIFLRIRRKLNHETFHISAKENDATLQMVQGMQEIRLNNAEKLKRWEWENIQAAIFKIGFKNLKYEQWQSAGALFINQGKDIFISFIVAYQVIDGKLTFGAMLAVQYIIGQLSGPVQQFIGLAQNVQDAKISMERLNEIHEMPEEEPREKTFKHILPENKSIRLSNLSFTYPGTGNDPVLENINLHIEEGKVTAIVGTSGSGKTTLLKLLLKVYGQYSGEIMIGEARFDYISPSYWRSQCGAVLQDGYIFNDTIAQNIAVGNEYIDEEKLYHSCRVANILSFIESLPNGFHTKLGTEGTGISQGQRQRLLIARAIYKDPHYLLFDEATNSLDANNEKVIVENLKQFFEGRTVVVVAHRLSTVKDANKIIVLHEGKIAEEGTHEELVTLNGRYYALIKNQLELGN